MRRRFRGAMPASATTPKLSPTPDDLSRYSLPAPFNVYRYFTQSLLHAVPVVAYRVPVAPLRLIARALFGRNRTNIEAIA